MKKMKSLMTVALLFIAVVSFSQTSKPAPWAELKEFHNLMSPSFHGAEDGNFAPLKLKADSLSIVAKKWLASPIPSSYKPAETKAVLKTLVKQTKQLSKAVKKQQPDATLLQLITAAHDSFHKVVGECRKEEE